MSDANDFDVAAKIAELERKVDLLKGMVDNQYAHIKNMQTLLKAITGSDVEQANQPTYTYHGPGNFKKTQH